MKKVFRSVAVATAMLLAASGCAFPAAAPTIQDAGVSQKADEALAKLKTEPGSPGPNGEAAAPASAVELTPQEIEQIKALKAKAGISLHFGGNDWSNAQVLPSPLQFSHAPKGLLNEKERGSSCGTLAPHSGQASFCD